MSDARALLRAARAERRIQHPNAQYTAAGKLTCNLCQIGIKDDKKAWNSHLTSTQHTFQHARMSDAAPANKKRKVDDADDLPSEFDERKRVRGPIVDKHDEYTLHDSNHTITEQSRPQNQNQDEPKSTGRGAQTAEQEAEFAAFLDDFSRDEDTISSHLPDGKAASATISVAPVTAEELAAQARNEESVQPRGRRDAELEAEKEDAAERMQEEFEEMEGLEARVKKLKDKRETLRRDSQAAKEGVDQVESLAKEQLDISEAVEEESSEDDDFDEWGFGVS